MLHNSKSRQMERLFNALPKKLQTVMEVKTEIFKRKLEWLRTMPDTPKINDYGVSVGVSTDSIVEHGKHECN